jgi:hypothetical protein
MQMKRPLLALACVTATYMVLAFFVLPQNAFFSSDEGLKFIQLQNFLRNGGSGLTVEYPGRGLDPGLDYVPINNPPALIRDGQIYAVYPVLFPLLAAPLYRVLSYAGLYVIPVVSALLTLVITCRLARLTGGSGTSATMVLGLCSPLVFYSLVFWDHTLGTMLSTLAILLVVKNLENPRQPWLIVGGILLGLAIWVRSEMYVMGLVMPAALFLLSRRRIVNTLSLCLGMLVALVPLWVFQFLVYGSFVGPHVGHFVWLAEELPITTDRVAIIYHTLLEGNSSPALSFLYIMAFVASALLFRSSQLRRRKLLIIVSFGILAIVTIPNILEAAAGRPLGGLITTAPFLAFGLTTLLDSSVGRGNKMLLAIGVGYTALVCVLTPVDPGLQWGPRFLLPILPPLAVVATNNFHALQAMGDLRSWRLLRACFISTVVLSIVVQAAGLRTLYIIKIRDRDLIQQTGQLDAVHIMSDEYGYAQYTAPLFYEKQFFYVRDQEEYQRLTETLANRDISTYAFVTYPVPDRQAVDPLDAPACCVVRASGPDLYEIAVTEGTP